MSKSLIYLFIAIGGGIGAYLPVVFGADAFSIWSIIGSTAGGLLGIYLAVRLMNN